jgi:hypothetical protein
LEIVYGIRVEGLHNRFLKMAEDALATAILPGIPGQFLVDAVPICRYNSSLPCVRRPDFSDSEICSKLVPRGRVQEASCRMEESRRSS